MSAQPRRIGAPAVTLATMAQSWEMALLAENKSPNTVTIYLYAVRLLDGHFGRQLTTDVTADELREFFAAMQRRMKAASVAVHFRSLRVFFAWLSAEEPSLMPVSPMAGMKAPVVPKRRKPPLPDDAARALLATCKEDTFENRRDEAILRVFLDTGMRVSGLSGIRLRYTDPASGRESTDVDLKRKTIVITLKGGDEIGVPLGNKSVAAIDRYLRSRVRHPHADTVWLWLGPRGQFTKWGVRQMLEKRQVAAGLEGVHPHRFRRTFAQNWLRNGGTEYDLMRITGWKTRDMIGIYTEELGEERAHAAHARITPGDRI